MLSARRSYANLSSKETFAIGRAEGFQERTHSEEMLEKIELAEVDGITFGQLSSKSSSIVSLCNNQIESLDKNIGNFRPSVKTLTLCCNR